MLQPISNNSAFMGSGLVRYYSDGVQRHQRWRLNALLMAGNLSHRVEGHQHGAIGDHGQQGGQGDRGQACCVRNLHGYLQLGPPSAAR